MRTNAPIMVGAIMALVGALSRARQLLAQHGGAPVTVPTTRRGENVGLATLALLALLAASAAWPVGSINAVFDKAEVTVGEPFVYTVTLTLAAGAQAELPGEKAKFGQLEVRDYNASEAPQADGSRLVTLNYTLVAFDVGSQEVGDFRVPVTDSLGKRESYLAPPVAIKVKSVLPEKGEVQPKGFYGPVTLKPAWTDWLWGGLIALLIAALVVLVVWFIKRRQREKKVMAPEVILAPDEAALLALDRLAASGLVAGGEVLEFYLRLDEILRAWLEARFELPAMNRTTQGLVYLLRVRRDTDPWRKEFVDVLRAGDRVKFAALIPDDQAAYDDLERAREIIRMVVPLLPEPDQEGERS